MEALNKACRFLNRVHQASQTDWDLCMPVVRWAYKAMCKNLSMEMILKLRNRVETKILEERNPHAIAPIVGTVHEYQDEGIM